jgi:hypothetical protein
MGESRADSYIRRRLGWQGQAGCSNRELMPISWQKRPVDCSKFKSVLRINANTISCPANIPGFKSVEAILVLSRTGATRPQQRLKIMVALEMPREFVSHPVMKQVSGIAIISLCVDFNDQIVKQLENLLIISCFCRTSSARIICCDSHAICSGHICPCPLSCHRTRLFRAMI